MLQVCSVHTRVHKPGLARTVMTVPGPQSSDFTGLWSTGCKLSCLYLSPLDPVWCSSSAHDPSQRDRGTSWDYDQWWSHVKFSFNGRNDRWFAYCLRKITYFRSDMNPRKSENVSGQSEVINQSYSLIAISQICNEYLLCKAIFWMLRIERGYKTKSQTVKRKNV